MIKLKKHLLKPRPHVLHATSSNPGNGCIMIFGLLSLFFILPILIGGERFVHIIDIVIDHFWLVLMDFALIIILPIALIFANSILKNENNEFSVAFRRGTCIVLIVLIALLIYGIVALFF